MKKSIVSYALSLAAGWAWGVSLIVGMQTLQTKGILPFLIWAIANSLALPLFGYLAFRIKKLHRVVDSKIVQVFTTLVMVFCLLIQMNSIHDILKGTGIFNDIWCKIIPIGISVVMALGLFHNGLIRNILIDCPLWALCYIVLLILLIIGVFSGTERYNLVLFNNKDDLAWALNSSLILFAGPFMNIQNWQMAEKIHKEKVLEISHVLAGIFFAVYMIMVALLSMFHFTKLMGLVQVIAILCITCTTIDASIVGMQKIAGEKVGLIIAVVTIVFWQKFISLGVLELWTIMGNWRKYVAIVCVIVALLWQRKERSMKTRR